MFPIRSGLYIQKGLRHISTNFPRCAIAAPSISKKGEYYKNLGVQIDADVKVEGWDGALPFDAIPGPKPLPIVGNMLRFLPYVGEFHGIPMHKIHEVFRQKYGDICTLRGMLGKRDMVFLYNADDMETALRNSGAWPIRYGLPSFIHYRTKTRKDIFQGVGGVMTVQGEEWFKIRSVVNPILMQPRTAQMYVSSMDKVANDLIENIRNFSRQNDNNEMPEDFQNELYRWTMESIGVIALDTRLGVLQSNLTPEERAEKIKFMNSTIEMFELMYKLDVLPSLWTIYSTSDWKKYVETLDYLTYTNLKYIDKALKKMNEEPERPEHEQSVLQRLIKIDRKTAIAMVTDMMIAGIDTTGRVMGAALYFLAKNPEKQEKLRKEVFKNLPSKDHPVTKEVLTNSPYLKAVIKETTRISPIAVGNLRTTIKDMVLSGYKIPKGTDCITLNIITSQEEKHFKNAKEFMPERWLRTTNDEFSHKDVNPFVYLPFGFGPRSCVGKRLANLELEVGLAKIIRNFKLSWHHPDMEFSAKLLYGISSPLKLKIIENEK